VPVRWRSRRRRAAFAAPLTESHRQPVSSSPLIEPDVRIPRIRLSDRSHARVCSRTMLRNFQNAVPTMQLLVTEAPRSREQLVPPPQEIPRPVRHVDVHGPKSRGALRMASSSGSAPR
jgi:hypothetical protein